VSPVVLAGVGTLAPLPGGGFLAGERKTGAVHEVAPTGTVRAGTAVSVAVAPPITVADERGLTGLVVDGTGRVFAVWVGAAGSGAVAGRVTVGQVFPDARTVWVGPPAPDHALGGALTLAPDGRLLVAIGDLGAPERVADPVAPNGKLLKLDPEGAPNQAPEVVSSGWHDPTGIAYGPDGRLWVVDRRDAGGGRLAEGDKGGRPAHAVALPGGAVRGIASFSARDVVVCVGDGDGRLERRALADTGPAARGAFVVAGCSNAVTRLVDGRLAAATSTTVQIIAT